ncbi:hypothetical protein Tco_0175129 [Tanacetum coccineum]
MSRIIPPIPPLGNPGSPNPNRVDMMPNDTINMTTTTNVAQNVVDENLPQLLTQEEVLMSQMFLSLTKRISRVRKLVQTAKAMWNDFILAHEGPSDIRDTKIVALRLKFNAFKSLEGEKVNGIFTRLKYLLNDLENNGVIIPQAEVNATFVNSLPRKWLSMNQTQRANNTIKNDSLATLYGKYNYEEGLIDQIYESETQRFTVQALSSKALISNNQFQDSDSDIKEDLRSGNEFMAYLNAEFHERALLMNQKMFYKRSGRVGSARKPIDKSKENCFTCRKQDYKGKYKGLKAEMVVLTKRIDDLIKRKCEKGKSDKGKSEKRLIAESFDWDDESVSSEDEDTTKIKAFMKIAEDESSVRKANARSDYSHVDLHYVEVQRKNLVNKFNLLKQKLSSHKSELSNLKNTVSVNCSLQNEIIRVNLENESLKDEISNLKKVIEKWTCSKLTLDQLLFEQVPGNIIKVLGGRGKRKEKIFSKEVIFTKPDESSYVLIPDITFDFESEYETQEPLPPLPKLIGSEPASTLDSFISLADLTLNMADLTLNTTVPKKIKQTSDKVSPFHVKKKTKTKPSSVLVTYTENKVDLSAEQLLLTLIEEVKGLKEQIKTPSSTPPSTSQTSCSKLVK